MGFNLRQKLEETFADINPFDNGATAQTVRANRTKAAPAQTVKTQTQSRPMVQQNKPTFQNQSLYQSQTQVPTLNFNNSMPKAQVFGSSNDPLKMGQVKSPQLAPAQPAKPVQYTAPTAQQSNQQRMPLQPKVEKSQVSGISDATWAKMNAQTRQNLLNTENKAKQARGDVWNIGKVAGDVKQGVIKPIISGLQQSAGNVGDVALMGGNMLSDTAAAMQGKSQTERDAINRRFEGYRDKLKGLKTVTGDSLNARPDFQWTGDTNRDISNLAGRSLQVGLDATTFVNPTRQIATGATTNLAGKQALKQLAGFSARDATFFGVGQGLTTGAETYGQTGDINQALTTGAQAGLLSAAGQGAMDIGGFTLGATARGIGKQAQASTPHAQLMRTDPTYKANTDKLTAVDATIARAQANGDIRALEGLQAVKAQLSDSNALIARRYAEQGFIGGKNATGFKDAEARGEVFEGVAMSIDEGKIDPTAALKAEALKYKSADEFIKAQGEPLYHGSPNHEVIRKNGFKTNPNGNNLLGEGVYLTRHRSKAENYSYPMDLADRTTITQEGRSAGVVDAYIPKGTKIFQPESRAELKNLTTKDLQNKGYGGVEINGETVIFDSAKIKTKEQLTDLYNQAHAPQPKPEVAQPKPVAQAKVEAPKQPTPFEQDLKKAGLGTEPDAYRKQPKDVKKAIDAYIANENPQLAYALDSKLHFPDGIPKVRPEDVKRITGLTPREAGIPPIYVSKSAAPMDKLAVDYETTVRGNTSGELKMTSEDFLDTMMDAIEANRSVGQQTKLIRELRNSPEVIAKAKATLEAERAQYGAPEVVEPSKSDIKAYEKMLEAKAKPATTPASQKTVSPEPSEVPVLPAPKVSTKAQPSPTSSTSGSVRATSSKRESLAPTQRPQAQEVKVETSPSENSAYTPKVVEKPKIVKEQRRAIKQGATETYGLRDSFDASDNVPQELKDSLGAFGNSRTVKSNKELWNDAQARMQDPAEAMKFFTETSNDESVATGYALINRYMKQGNTKEAGDLAMIMAERALESGRQTQAYAMMKKLTPEGSVTYVARRVKKYLDQNPKMADKVQWNDATQKKLYKMAEELNKLPEGRERNLKIGEMQQAINNIFPSSTLDKLITVWKAGLLTSLRTHERNLIGNTINLASEQVSSAPASLADRLMSLRTKERTIVSSMGEGLSTGAGYGAKLAKDQLKTGIDVTNSNLKMDMNHITWGNNKVEKFFKVYTDGVFRTLGAEDKLFRQAAEKNSLYSQAMAQAKSKKLKGNVYDEYVKSKVETPTAKMLDIANDDAGRATFTHDNVLGEIIKSAKQTVRKTKHGKVPAAVLDFLVPFTQVPSGVASQLYHYSPAKLVKSMYDIGKVLVTGDVNLQRKAAQGFGRSVIGTSVLGAGAYMMSQGLMTGQPEDDAERAQWEAEGKMANSIKVGDRWYQLGSIGPQTLLFLAGGQAVKDAQNGRNPLVTTTSNLGKNFKDQTFLKGMSSALDAVDDPKRYADSFVESQATSIVPNIVKDVAKATDPNAREAIGVVDKFKAATPGLSQTLPVQRDSYGQEIKNQGIRHMVDLFNSKKEKDVPESAYIDALRESTGNKEHVPSIADKSIQINGAMKKLTSQEYEQYQKYIGLKGKDYIGSAMNNPEFRALSPDEQVKKIDQALQDINSAAKTELFGNTRKDGKVMANVQDIITNGKATVDASLTKASGVKGTPQEKYDSALKTYNANKAKMSDVQRYATEKDLAAMKVRAPYSSDVVSLYSLSKEKISDFLSTSKDGNKQAEDLIKLDRELYDAGITSYLKFKTGIAPARGGSRKSSGRGSKVAKGKFDYKLNGFGTPSASNSKQLHDLLKKATMRVSA